MNKNILRIVIGTLCLLLIPLIFNWPWTVSDFVVAGVLILGTGLVLNWAMLKFPKRRLLIGAGILLVFMYVWAELAVGIFTNLGS